MKLNKMPKNELELLSLTEIAKLYLLETKKTLTTKELFQEVCNLLELSETEYEEKIADFFESLTTSKEFILLEDGKWDLKTNHSVKVVIEEIEDEEEENPEDNLDELNPDEEENIDDVNDDDNYLDDDADDDLSDLTIVEDDELEE